MPDKKSFIFYTNTKEVLQILSDEQLGRLMRLLIDFAEERTLKNDIDDPSVNMAYRFITAQMQRDFDKWENTRKRRSEAGKKGMATRWNDNEAKQTITNDNKAKQTIANDNKAKQTITNITDNVNVNDNGIIINNNNNISAVSPKQQKPKRKRYGEYNHVLLTDSQYEKLISDYGEQTTKEYIDKIDQWIQLKGKSPYKDFNLAIRNWIKRDGTPEKEEINEKYAGTAAMQGII